MAGVMEMFRQAVGMAPQSVQLNPQTGQPMLPAQVQQMNQNVQQGQQTQDLQTQQTEQKKEPSPEELFKDFWTNDPKTDAVTDDLSKFSFNFDQKRSEQLGQNIAKLDFTKGLSPDLATKIAAGGPEAISAMFTAMNYVGQQAMKNAVIASAQVTENGIATTGKRVTESLPQMIRQQTVSNALREDNPLFNDPSTAPMLAAIESQMAAKFPSATPAEIRENAKSYLANFATKAAEFSGHKMTKIDSKDAQQSTRNAVQNDWSQEPI